MALVRCAGQSGGSRRRQGAASKQLRMADFVKRDLRAILRVEDVDLVRCAPFLALPQPEQQ